MPKHRLNGREVADAGSLSSSARIDWEAQLCKALGGRDYSVFGFAIGWARYGTDSAKCCEDCPNRRT
jgi:hypothetical protein